MIISNVITSNPDQSLLSLRGKIANSEENFLLDSGASCNFISFELLKKLGIDHDLVISQKVKLADGSLLKTCGKVKLRVSFDSYTYFGTFYVL